MAVVLPVRQGANRRECGLESTPALTYRLEPPAGPVLLPRAGEQHRRVVGLTAATDPVPIEKPTPKSLKLDVIACLSELAAIASSTLLYWTRVCSLP